jgi:hypothetical protein
MDLSLGRKEYEKKQGYEKEENILWGHAHDLSTTKLCTIITSTGTKVDVLLPIAIAIVAYIWFEVVYHWS